MLAEFPAILVNITSNYIRVDGGEDRALKWQVSDVRKSELTPSVMASMKPQAPCAKYTTKAGRYYYLIMQ